MEYSIKSGNPEKQRTACLAGGIFEPRKMSPTIQQIDQASGGIISSMLRRGDIEGKLGQTLLLHNLPGVACERVLLVGCGREKAFSEGPFRQMAAKATSVLNETGTMDASLFLTELPVKGRDSNWKIRHFIEAAEEALYRFDQLKSEKDKERRPLRRMTLFVNSRTELGQGEIALQQAVAISRGTSLARDLGNLPGNICTPSYLAEQAHTLADESSIETHVLEEEDMEKLGMGALLSVSRGSRQPAKLIIMEYRGGPEDEAPVVLVGKGLTFDAGGISIKPAASMDEMKYDMCGGASVFGTLQAVAAMALPINLIGVVPSSENLPDGDANKPGDVVTTLSGQTVEILNTDAEGRLILCDALTYCERFEPAVVVDIATLTGACVIALGHHASGLMGNNDKLIKELLNAGTYAHDRVWQLPLWDDYQRQLDSNFADMANIGGRPGGSITAACFLSRYTKKLAWAHLDIAGTAWKTGKEKGATGRPVGLLSQFILNRCNRNEATKGR
ncbi:MAG: leucyl aminopeptidase [Gammaproteobacteria bacterium]|nr:leucyl aminopeptidase [Gammaproteobacteria bacterium]